MKELKLIWFFIQTIAVSSKKVKFCLVCTCMLWKIPKIKFITHKYLITGHTQNEGDSVLSTIGKAIKETLKSGAIYVPSQYAQIIRPAKKKGKLYIVNEMSHSHFYSLKAKALCQEMGFNSKVIKTSEIKIFKVIQNEPTIAYLKYSYSDFLLFFRKKCNSKKWYTKFVFKKA